MNRATETVVLACEGCGKEIIRPEGKVGVLVKCSQCQTVNWTPAIAMQTQATELQLARMQKCLKRFRAAMWLPFFAIIPLAIVAVLSGLESLAYLVEGGLLVFLLFCMIEAREFLGDSKVIAFFFLFCFPPACWVMIFSTYFRFRKRVWVLVLNGARATSPSAPEQHSGGEASRS